MGVDSALPFIETPVDETSALVFWPIAATLVSDVNEICADALLSSVICRNHDHKREPDRYRDEHEGTGVG